MEMAENGPNKHGGGSTDNPDNILQHCLDPSPVKIRQQRWCYRVGALFFSPKYLALELISIQALRFHENRTRAVSGVRWLCSYGAE